MSTRPFAVRLPLERAWRREVQFALQLLDPVTLERVSQGIAVTAVGLAGAPIVNAGGLFVWLKEAAPFDRLVVDPGTSPYEPFEIPAAQVQRPLHTVRLTPRADYPFAAGITALRGALYASAVPAGTDPVPVAGATIRLAWLDEDHVTWIAAPATAVTDARGQFAAVLRLARDEVPALDGSGAMSVRVFARRPPLGEKYSDLQLPHGRVTDTTCAWDAMV
jgi:hypothetical protein